MENRITKQLKNKLCFSFFSSRFISYSLPVILTILFFLMLLWPTVFAQDADSSDAMQGSIIPSLSGDVLDQKISLDFKNIEIIDALKFVSQKAGLNIIPTKKVTGRINLNVENATLRDVFDIMLRSNELAYAKKGEIYNVMTDDEYRIQFGKNFNDTRQVKVFRLSYAVPDQVVSLCESLKSVIGKVLMDYESGNILVLDTPEKLKLIGETIESLENKMVDIKVFDLKYAKAKDVAETLKAQLDIKKVGTIKADEPSNQVIVQTLPKRMKDIEKLILSLDRKTREVLLDVRVIKIALTNDLNVGVEWEGLFNVGKRYGLSYLGSYPFSAIGSASQSWTSRKDAYADVGYVGSYPFSGTTSNTSASTKGMGLEKMHVGVIGKNDFDFIFRYLRTLGEAKVMANPKIAIVENQEAKVHIGERQAYITSTTTQSSSATTIAEQVTFVDVGIKLFVTPTINTDGFVTIKVKPEVSSVTSFLTTSGDNKIPIISTSTTETTVMVKDAATIFIGGLKEETKTSTTEETPIFSKIPILGFFLRSKQNTTRRNEFLVMLTPHIITGEEITTGYERDFGYKLDKEDQKYSKFTDEVLTLNYKSYRNYSQPEYKPSVKPMQEF